MRHLIIGAGNMGTRHGQILRHVLHEKVEQVDIEFKPQGYLNRYDSILICTPAETHAQLIHDLPNKPIFCEKPLITAAEQSDLLGEKIAGKSLSLVAQNWRWCRCIKKEWSRLDLFYPKANYLDSIHFSFLGPLSYLKLHGETSIVQYGDKVIVLHARNGENLIDFKGFSHSDDCVMFIDQMKHWLEVIERKQKSINPFELALKHTKDLINLANKIKNSA